MITVCMIVISKYLLVAGPLDVPVPEPHHEVSLPHLGEVRQAAGLHRHHRHRRRAPHAQPVTLTIVVIIELSKGLRNIS